MAGGGAAAAAPATASGAGGGGRAGAAAAGAAAVPLGVLEEASGVPLEVATAAEADGMAEEGGISTSLDRVRGLAPPASPPTVLLFATNAAEPLALLAGSLPSPTSPLALKSIRN